MSRMRVWMQACRLGNIQHKLVDIRYPASWDVPILILNEVGLLRDSEVNALLDYVKRGNTLIISGSNGIVDENSQVRSTEQRSLLDCKDLDGDACQVLSLGQGKLVRVGYAFGYPGSRLDKQKLFVDNPARFNYVSIIDHIKNLAHIADSYDDRKNPSSAVPHLVYQAAAGAFKQVQELLQKYLTPLAVTVKNLPEGVLYSVYRRSESEYVVHLLNAAGCLEVEENTTISHQDRIPFLPHSGEGEIILSSPAVKIEMLTMEETTVLNCSSDRMKAILPLEKLRNYAMLKIFM